jgi:hypothetical protein
VHGPCNKKAAIPKKMNIEKTWFQQKKEISTIFLLSCFTVS